MSKLNTQPRQIFVFAFAASFLLASTFSAVSAEDQAYYTGSLDEQSQQLLQQFSQSQLDYIRSLLGNALQGTTNQVNEQPTNEEQSEEVQEPQQQYEPPAVLLPEYLPPTQQQNQPSTQQPTQYQPAQEPLDKDDDDDDQQEPQPQEPQPYYPPTQPPTQSPQYQQTTTKQPQYQTPQEQEEDDDDSQETVQQPNVPEQDDSEENSHTAQPQVQQTTEVDDSVEVGQTPQVNQQQDDDNSDEEHCDGYKAYPENLAYYLQYDGTNWFKRPCPLGLGFDADKCACVILLSDYKTSTYPTTTTVPTTTSTRPTTTTTTTTTQSTTTTTTPTTTTTTPTTTTTTPTSTTTRPTTTTVTSTTTRRTTTGKPSLDLCRDCVILHGVGYAPYPGYCDAYIQCQFSGSVPSSAAIRRCPTGLQWNQNKLTCDFPEIVQCKSVIAKCPRQKEIVGNKQEYLSFNGYTWTQIRCPVNQVYSDLVCGCTESWGGYGNFETCADKRAIAGDKTGYLQLSPSGWIRMPCPKTLGYDAATCRCTDTLETSDIYTNCPNTKPIPGDVTGYLQFNGVSWVRMPCPASVGYDPRTCQCSHWLKVKGDKDDKCEPSLALTFEDNSATDTSINQFWVNNTGVTFRNGKAYFDGQSQLTVPGFSNMDLGNTVTIAVTFSQTGHSQQTIVTNGDCGVLQSLGVCSSQNSVDFFAETVIQKAQVSVAKPVSKDANTWQSVVYSLYKDQLTGYVDKPFSTSTKEVKGSLVRNHRGLVIGGGGECGGFTGAIDQIYVFLCNPRAR